jgi:hypothetical protein
MIGRPFPLLTEAILTPSLVFTYWISGRFVVVFIRHASATYLKIRAHSASK